ncbi:LOW QUALITY PROTEIN: Pol protein [Phytophthora palmivora]|uniref:Pol protein n=1 Tax=Phytophthora palmivora TaxID=4796 RepID=A0A2P4X2B7_9STRA|nr:LOW QUALITY PROTEIN: Pol protein [Phytophthora palmivora]
MPPSRQADDNQLGWERNGPKTNRKSTQIRTEEEFNCFKQGELVLLDTKNLPINLVSSVGSNKLKHRFIGPFAVLARHGAAYTIDLPKSMATHPTFCVGRLKRYHDPLGLPSRTEEDQGENSPPRNESSGQPELPVSKSVTDTQAGTHESHTKGMTVEWEELGYELYP